MKVLHIVFVCLLLTGCGPSPEQLTATAVAVQAGTSTASAKSQLEMTATIEAEREATRAALIFTMAATVTKAAQLKAVTIEQAKTILDEIESTAKSVDDLEVDFSEAKLAFGPRSDTLTHEIGDSVIVFDPELSLKNFVVSIKFINPYDTSTTGKWDYGILFRNEYGNNQYRWVALSNQSWTLYNAEKDAYVYSSNDKNLESKAGEANTIWLVVVDKKAHLFINGIYAKSLDVSARLTPGDVSPATGLYTGNVTEKRSTEYQDFTVWSLP
jgi:hypothetical protein